MITSPISRIQYRKCTAAHPPHVRSRSQYCHAPSSLVSSNTQPTWPRCLQTSCATVIEVSVSIHSAVCRSVRTACPRTYEMENVTRPHISTYRLKIDLKCKLGIDDDSLLETGYWFEIGATLESLNMFFVDGTCPRGFEVRTTRNSFTELHCRSSKDALQVAAIVKLILFERGEKGVSKMHPRATEFVRIFLHPNNHARLVTPFTALSTTLASSIRLLDTTKYGHQRGSDCSQY